MKIWALIWLLAIGLAAPAQAHVDNPAVVFEGNAGPYPVRAVVRLPGVVPGLAEISVRVLSEGAERVTVLPVHWRTGAKGSPSPDVAQPVRGEKDLYSAGLWLMTGGAYSIEIQVEGPRGSGLVTVPVNSVATRRLEMNRGFGLLLAALGLMLFMLMVSIAGAAIRESMLPPGITPSRVRRWMARGVMAGAILVAGLAVAGGKRWWDSVDRDYRNRRMYKPSQAHASVRATTGGRVLELTTETGEGSGRRQAPLVPDHGKIMHLFMLREPSLDVFAHLHPVRREENRFEVLLPPIPTGPYRLYADVTYETGFAETLTAEVQVPSIAPSSHPGTSTFSTIPSLAADPEDSWQIDENENGSPIAEHSSRVQHLPGSYTMTLEGAVSWTANRDATLRLVVRDAQGRPAELKPYLGMFSHAALRKVNGSVFSHLHPVGTISLAAQQVMQLRALGKDPAIVTAEALEAFCKDPPAEQSRLPLQFPVVFPEPGRYRLWVQIKPSNEVVTAVFDLDVHPAL